MNSRTRTGITVHSTSINVLWVVREGVGLRFSLKRTITTTSNPSTNAEMITTIHNSLSCSRTTFCMTGVAASWKLHSHSFGLSASAAAGANANAASVAQKAPSLANTIFAPSEVPSPDLHPAARPLSPIGRAITRAHLHPSFPYHECPTRRLPRLIPVRFRAHAGIDLHDNPASSYKLRMRTDLHGRKENPSS